MTGSVGRVVVAGASGVVGEAAVRRFAEAGWDVVGLCRRPPAAVDGARFLALDLADAAAARAVVREELAGTTHLVFAALHEEPGLFAGWFSPDQMARNLALFANLLDPLDEVAPLEHVSVLQGTKAYGVHVGRSEVPCRESEPRHPHENFYWLQEDHLRARQAGRPWSFTIWRPQVVFGEALGSNMNAISAIGVLGALRKADGRPLGYPGGAPFVSEAVDADLLARALVWAARTDAARGETFNVTNGDVFTLRASWPAIVDALGCEPGPDEPVRLAEELPAREADWAAVVAAHSLAAPVSVERFVGQSALYADMLLATGRSEPGQPVLVSTVKLRQAGFGDCTDTDDMFRRIVAGLQSRRLLPPR